MRRVYMTRRAWATSLLGFRKAAVQEFAQLGGKLRAAERLAEELCTRRVAAFAGDRPVRIAGSEQNFHIRYAAAGFLGELPAIHAVGHDHVGEEKVWLQSFVEQLQRTRSLVGSLHAIAKRD